VEIAVSANSQTVLVYSRNTIDCALTEVRRPAAAENSKSEENIRVWKTAPWAGRHARTHRDALFLLVCRFSKQLALELERATSSVGGLAAAPAGVHRVPQFVGAPLSRASHSKLRVVGFLTEGLISNSPMNPSSASKSLIRRLVSGTRFALLGEVRFIDMTFGELPNPLSIISLLL
jgi:hypothetical protein